MSAAVPRWARVVTVAAVLVVAAVAALVSYAHMRSLGQRAGEGWRSDVLPLSVDGLLVAASLVIYVRRRAGLRAGSLPWLGLVLGVLASVAANIAAAEPTVLGRVVAAWPPLAFALSFELLVVVLRDGAVQGYSARPEIDGEALNGPGEGEGTGAGRDWWPTAPFADTPEGRAAELIAQGAGRRKLAAELGVSEYEARRLLAERNGAVR